MNSASDPSPVSDGELESYLREHIPLTDKMGLTVDHSELDRVVLRAPLGLNVNHANTVFGGSASALAMMAGWGLVHLRFHDRPGDTRIVIQRNEMEFLEPIVDEFTAVCESPGQSDWEKMASSLERWDKSRIHLEVNLFSEDQLVAEFQGSYVIEAH